MQKAFDLWSSIKKATDAADDEARLLYREGEIWWVRLGKNIGYELDGKSRQRTRPEIIRVGLPRNPAHHRRPPHQRRQHKNHCSRAL